MNEVDQLKAALHLAQRWAAEAADALLPSAEENSRLRDEVERLNTKVTTLRVLMNDTVAERNAGRAEIERLRAAERNYQAAHDLQHTEIERLADVKTKLQDGYAELVAQNERLKAALWELDRDCGCELVNRLIARAALEGK